MCWAFVDSWLLDSGKEAEELMQRQGTRHYFLPARPAHIHRKKKRTRYVEQAPTEVKRTEKKALEGMYEYIPVADTPKKKKKQAGRKQKPDRKEISSKGNEWTYVPAPSAQGSEKRAREKTSSKSSSKPKVSFAPSAFVQSFTSLTSLACAPALPAPTTSLQTLTHI